MKQLKKTHLQRLLRQNRVVNIHLNNEIYCVQSYSHGLIQAMKFDGTMHTLNTNECMDAIESYSYTMKGGK